VSVQLDEGRHEFQALTLITRRFPALAAPALRRAAGERGDRDVVVGAVSEGRQG
jgi:hypothetical protein